MHHIIRHVDIIIIVIISMNKAIKEAIRQTNWILFKRHLNKSFKTIEQAA